MRFPVQFSKTVPWRAEDEDVSRNTKVMRKPRTVRTPDTRWPPPPPNGVLPELLTTIEVGQLLRYDLEPSRTVGQATRNVRLLVRDHGLPMLGRVGRRLLFSKVAVVDWLKSRGSPSGAEILIEKVGKPE